MCNITVRDIILFYCSQTLLQSLLCPAKSYIRPPLPTHLLLPRPAVHPEAHQVRVPRDGRGFPREDERAGGQDRGGRVQLRAGPRHPRRRARGAQEGAAELRRRAAAEPVQVQLDTVWRSHLYPCIPARYLLNTLLSARTWTRDQRLAALDNIAAEDVVQFAHSFLDNHSLECLYYGSIAKEQVASGSLCLTW